MFELVGYAVVRALGYGWAWGREDYARSRGVDYYGNGGTLLPIGFSTLVVAVGVAALVAVRVGG